MCRTVQTLPVKKEKSSLQTTEAHFHKYWHSWTQYWQFLLFGLTGKKEMGKINPQTGIFIKKKYQVQTLNDFK